MFCSWAASGRLDVNPKAPNGDTRTSVTKSAEDPSAEEASKSLAQWGAKSARKGFSELLALLALPHIGTLPHARVRECEADLGGGSVPLMLGESVPSLLSSPAFVHPKKRIFMHACQDVVPNDAA